MASPEAEGYLPLAAAAECLGLSVGALHKRVQRGQIASRKVDGRVYVQVGPAPDQPSETVDNPSPPPDTTVDTPSIPIDKPSTARDNTSIAAVHALSAALEREQSLVRKLQEENREMAGRVGFLQGQLIEASERLKALEAPVVVKRRWWEWWK